MSAEVALELLSGCALHRVTARDSDELLTKMAAAVVENGHGRPSLIDAVRAREQKFPTGLPTPVPSAIPHTDPVHVLHAGLAVATLAKPVVFAQMGGAGEQLAVEIVVLLCITEPGDQVGALQEVLARLGDGAAVAAVTRHDDPATFEVAVRSWLKVGRPVSSSAAS